ncbi:Cas1p-domain-containing protein [Daldinia caldariorum]|uniref:Cas1p-domain-containing protein n=1 Tax=Daldinia caldariorum TaxID=326644 RepID=UPI002007C364|nr:Cas1p-domain-containing protein [Daldinia caldariorum]KAI1467141.1 Cas1p-domain-containing protein [Daldinia caldariorum]
MSSDPELTTAHVSTLNFCILLILLLTTLQTRHEVGLRDPHQCLALLQNGTWSPVAPDGSQRWEPRGCRMVEHTTDSLCTCLNGRKVVFVGDSTIRQLFWNAGKKVTRGHSETRMKRILQSDNKHADISFRTDCAQLEFIWDPWLNSTALYGILKAFDPLPPSPREGTITEMKVNELSPVLVVLGAPGFWAARYGGDDYLNLFKRAINGIVPYLSPDLDSNISSIMTTTRNSGGVTNKIFLTPVGIPNYESLSLNRSKSITPGRVEAMNNHLAQVFPGNSTYIPWVFNKFPVRPGKHFDTDGLHASEDVASLRLDIIFNAFCNTAASARSRSFRGTCCVAAPENDVFVAACMLLGLAAGFTFGARRALEVSGDAAGVRFGLAFGNILIALVWCWYADGASFLGKAERHYQQSAFARACVIWLMVSALSSVQNTQQPDGSSSSKRVPPGYRGPGYMSRIQSNEMKGLMQGFILLYHYHYASQALWVYKIIRLFIAGYLYISGYAHTQYFLTTNDFSVQRLIEILFRINLLSVSLSYMMGTTYTSYYFAPVATFWYLVSYMMLFIFKSRNRDMRWLLFKVLLTTKLTEWFILTPGVLETASKIMYALFFISIDPEEMRFRLGLDRYIPFVGIVVAALVHRASVRRARTVLQLGCGKTTLSLRFTRLLTAICIGGVLTFLYVTQTYLPDKKTYNHMHPLISWIPILGYVVLRNSTRRLRDRFLSIPHYLGSISLETYVLQYHIWLCGDATAKLTVGYAEGR